MLQRPEPPAGVRMTPSTISLLGSVSFGWLHEQGGLRYDEPFFLDPSRRVEQEQTANELVSRRFADDWGFWYTATTNLDRVKNHVDGVDALHAALDRASSGEVALTVVRGADERELEVELNGGSR